MVQKLGSIPYQLIRQMIAAGYVNGSKPEHIQPASLDLSVSDEIYRMRGSYLPRKGESVRDLIKQGSLGKHDVNEPLKPNHIYLIRLNESLTLPPMIHASTSNKSSSGRINLRARLIADGVPRFDEIPSGYHGSLWIEVIPKSFAVRIHPDDRINQMRFFQGDPRLSSLEHRLAYDHYGLLRCLNRSERPNADEHVDRGITMTVDLTTHQTIGWRSKQRVDAILDTAIFTHKPEDFFEPVARQTSGELILEPGAFYILATKERILVPPMFSAEMAAYDSSKGEFRSHFAGFFDPGWGMAKEESDKGKIAVLEIEAYSHDFVLRDAQPICLMVFEHVLETPEKLYGEEMSSHYDRQSGPKLAKWFTQT